MEKQHRLFPANKNGSTCLTRAFFFLRIIGNRGGSRSVLEQKEGCISLCYGRRVTQKIFMDPNESQLVEDVCVNFTLSDQQWLAHLRMEHCTFLVLRGKLFPTRAQLNAQQP